MAVQRQNPTLARWREITQAQEWDLQAKDRERKHDDEMALELRLMAASVFEEQGLLYDAAYSYGHAGQIAIFLDNPREQSKNKIHAARLYIQAFNYLQRGGSIWEITANRRLGAYCRDQEDKFTGNATFRDTAVLNAAYQLSYAVRPLYLMNHHQLARKAATIADAFFESVHARPNDKVIKVLARYLPEKYRTGNNHQPLSQPKPL